MTTQSNVTQHPALTDSEKREQLRSRIEAGKERLRDRDFVAMAQDAASGAVDFAKRRPLTVVAGAVVAGLAIGAMTRPGRRLGKKGGALAAVAADAAIAYGLKFLDEAGKTAGDLGDTVSDTGRRLGSAASDRASAASEVLRSAAKSASSKGKGAARDLRSIFIN